MRARIANLYKLLSDSRGFSIAELLLVMGIMAVLLGIITLNLVSVQNRTNLNSSIDILVAEIKQQQTKSMIGDTEGRTSPSSYGVYFETDQYTLFNGTSFNPSAASNIVVELDDNMQFSDIDLVNGSVIFDRVNGEIVGYNPSLSSVTITNTTDKQSRTIQFNRYGVITAIN